MDSIQNNKQISFWDLLSSDTSKIEIPIIQRDYAQGRDNNKTNKIRIVFLNSLLSSLEADNKELELDFVYGNMEKNIFQPLDGQQRLTTLFLLHWYISLKTGNLGIAKEQLKKFTYETRITSRDFCNALVENGEFLGEGETISIQICDSKWFFLSWRKDPTIKAMLIMLDGIEEHIKDKDLSSFWQKLTSENAPITFVFKELKDIGLTDDLYIKMNDRGKSLTDFENFKARFEKYIKGGNPDKKDWEDNLKSDPRGTYSHKIDTLWTDLFWKHRGDDNIVDNEFIKFIAGIAINLYAQNLQIIIDQNEELKVKKALDEKSKVNVSIEAVKRERIERRIATLFNDPTDVGPEDFPTLDSFHYLKECFDVYSKNKNDELIPKSLPLWDYCESKMVKINSFTAIENTLFTEFIKDGKTEYKQRVLFYAQTQYLLKQQTVDPDYYSDWMRVIRNIVQNSAIDSATTFIGAINLVNELSQGSDKIYFSLPNQDITSGFAKNQVEEEKLKSTIITKSLDNKTVIFQTEDTNFFKGKIIFALYCIDFENPNDVFNVTKLSCICNTVKEHLSSSDITNSFRRAMLTIRDNQFYNYWWSWSYGTDSNKRCLVESTLDLKNNFTQGGSRIYLKELLLQLIDRSLDQIIDEYNCPPDMPNWKCRLIKEPKLLEYYCQAHYIGIPHDNSYCYLFYYKKRPNSPQDCKKIK